MMPTSETENEKSLSSIMEEHQLTNGSSGVALCEDMFDEDDTPLIIDESCLPQENNHEKLTGNETPKLKAKKNVQEMTVLYPCLECGKKFRRKAKLQAHLLTHKSKEEMECENCGKKFRKVELLFDHVCSGIGNSYKCSDCDECFRLKRDLTVHQQKHKKVSTCDEALDDKGSPEDLDFSSFVASFVKWPISCTHCGDELANLENYNVHMAAHKEGQPCVCAVCKMKFLCRDDYLLHKDLCHIEGIFECTRCSKRFHTEKKLGEHLETHCGEGTCCDACGLNFMSKDKLVSHMKVHKVNVFVCGKCKIIFKCNSSFKNHTCSIQDSSEKKLYTFGESLKKKVNEHCLISASAIDESDSEDADLCQVINESHICKVCGDSFKQKDDLKLHLTNHFQCIECKKYFKNQTDLDMHAFLLAEEKVYSCCLCEAIVHGKKELEYHLSQHLGSDDVPVDDLEWDDNTEGVQNVIPSLDSTESSQPTLLENSVGNVKIHKVVPAGNNALKCSSCGKFVLLNHSFSSHMEANAPVTDSDEEFIYISRLGSPQNKNKQKEETYCTCHYKLNVSLSEQNPSKSLSEYECQEVQKLISASQISTHLFLPKSTHESVDSKSESFLSEVTEDNSLVQMDVSNDRRGNSDEPDDFDEMLKPETEANCKASLNSNQLLNGDSTKSSASIISDNVVKIDGKNRCENPKVSSQDSEVSSIKRTGIKVIKVDKNVETLPQKTNMKEIVSNSNIGSENIPIGKPVRILVSTGLFGASGLNVTSLPVVNNSELKKSASSPKNSVTKRSQPEMSLVNQEELILHSLTGDDISRSFPETPVSMPKKIKQEKSIKKVLPSKHKDKTEFIASQSKDDSLKLSISKKLITSSRPQKVKADKRKNVNKQVLNSSSVTEMKDPNKVDPMLRPRGKRARPSKRRPPFRKSEQRISKTRPDVSTSNTNGSEPCHVPESNMIFKVEQLAYESDDDEEEEESLDFSGIKKEFLASDVFIKEEEWDIVDF
ncbi:zinc finger protein 585A-like [Portunus trituberculatus]|uniref:zinc finger protein 585A-like n=1 Tax=Portunus trituberculatus TaxID=210409 RepID=UPI001E1CC15A|nr:zinc finger protein 585A-like [Portunus trituberculatus]XP_045104584.1 zinc finger protein 585A-like [Portunus trituberculatus]XP_045104585.1 zinc finger protein 585A-like [Portunus trituberculatus]